MGTTQNTSFADMLNQFLPNELLKEELIRRDYVLKTVDKDDTWNDGSLIVPFKAAGASSVSFGGLTASNDIAEDKYVRGSVSGPKEIWGAMIFNHRDLMEHGKVSEQNFLKILPDTVDDFMDYMKNVLSTNLLNGAHFATLTADGASGSITVDRPDRFVIDQKVFLIDGDTTISSAAFVSAININTGVITLVTARAGAIAFNAASYTLAQAAKVYNDGASTGSFSSIRGALLATGGDANIAGVAKTSYTYLQAINVDGSDISASNIMLKIFNALTTIRRLGKGNPTDVLMSYTNLGYCMAVIESSKGAFNVSPGSQKATQYGWMEIQVGSVTKGMLKLVGIQEADDDTIMFIDWRAIKFYSNGFFRKRVAPDGKEYFEQRATTGYTYIVDVCCFGELIVQRPSYCGILYGVSIA